MFTKIRNWLAAEVTSVETILAGFHSTVQKLEQHAETMYAKAVHLDTVVIEGYSRAIEAAQKDLDAAHAEATKAKDVAAKIKALVS